MKKVKLFEQFLNESDAYTISRMANDVGLGPVEDFLDKYDVNIELLTKDISQNTINKYELQDIIKGDAHSSKIKKFIKTYVNESIVTKKKSDYQVYHNTYSAAISTALDYAESQGYTYDKEETATKIGMGPKRPGDGFTNRFTIMLYKDSKEQKKALQISVYGMGSKYELNAYVA